MNDPIIAKLSFDRLPEGAADRLVQFALEHRVEAFPADQVLVDEGTGWTFGAAFLRYCAETGLSLDWFYFGEGAPRCERSEVGQ